MPHELVRLRDYGLIIVDEVGYIPFELDASNVFFQLVSSRYEHASLILNFEPAFARWGDVFGDQVASALIELSAHQAPTDGHHGDDASVPIQSRGGGGADRFICTSRKGLDL